jgi:hypothetical protein
LFGRFLEVKETVAPSSINWRNIQYSRCNRLTRSIIIWTLAVIIVALAFYGMVRFKDYNDSIKAGAGLGTTCPLEETTVDIAFEDYQKPGKQRQGLLHCYCLQVYQANEGDVSSSFPEFLALDPTLEENPCEEWKWVYENNFYLIIISGAMVGLLNSICVALFENIVIFEKCLTLDDQIKAQFSRIVMVQFLNIAWVLIFADFNLGYDSETTIGLPILQGNYRDFDTKWYFDVGAKISMAMVSNSISPFVGRIAHPFVQPLLRFILDRNFKKHLLRKTNIEEELAKLERESGKKPKIIGRTDPEEDKEGGVESTPNPQEVSEVGVDECETKQMFQDELNELYTNKMVEVFYLYSWFFTNLLVYLMFGGSMPIMYILGSIFFLLSYLSYKFLFIDYYRKSYGFSEEVPLYSVKLMKWAIFFHLLMILFMYTNKRLLTPKVYDKQVHYRPPLQPPDQFFERRYDTDSNRIVLLVVISLMVFYIFWRWIVLTCYSICQIRIARRKR